MSFVVFAGLPGTGKTTVARLVADRLGATFLRIDSIESAAESVLPGATATPVGYVVAERVAADQLRAGRPVVVDAVNDLEVMRAGWRRLGQAHEVPPRFVEVVCSDADLHRRRVEERTADLSGHVVPRWADVEARRWEPFDEPRLLVDNLGTADNAVAAVLTWLESGA